MNILMCSAQPYPPQVVGGAQASTHELCVGSIRHGHRVAALTGLNTDGWTGLRARVSLRLTGRLTASDRRLGYSVHRAWAPEQAAGELVRRLKPDVAVIPTSKAVPLGCALQDADVPLVVYLRDVELHELEGPLDRLRRASYIANSQFTADRYHDAFGISATVIPPLFRRELYVTSREGRHITFINPHPLKGVDIAIALAERLPGLPFCFVSGWPLAERDQAALDQRLARLPNVLVQTRTDNMREIYAQTRLLLVPSRWEEAWGRVVSEAHFSGIPVIATRIGGLPESVGPGGLLVDKDAPLDQWIAALRRLWTDEAAYEALSAAALDYSGRAELRPDRQIEAFLDVLSAATLGRGGVQERAA